MDSATFTIYGVYNVTEDRRSNSITAKKLFSRDSIAFEPDCQKNYFDAMSIRKAAYNFTKSSIYKKTNTLSTLKGGHVVKKYFKKKKG